MDKYAPLIINRFLIAFYALVIGIGLESSLMARGGGLHEEGGGARREEGGFRPENNRMNEEHRNYHQSYKNNGHMNYQQRENTEKLNDYRAGYNQGANEGEGASLILPDEVDDADQDYNNLLYDANDPNNPNNNQNSNQGQ